MKLSWVMAAAVLFAAGCSKEQKKVEEKVTRVEISSLEKRLFQQRIPVQGTVEPVQHAVISAKVGGTLEIFETDEGTILKKGDLLFGIDRQILKNQVVVKKDEIKVREAALESAKIKLNVANIDCKVAKNDLEVTKINLIQAQRDFERADNLKKSKAISDSSWESADTDLKKAKMAVKSSEAAVANAEAAVNNAEAEVKNAKAQLKQAESNLAIAEKNLKDSEVFAPFDCVVTETFVEKNEFVTTGQKILKVENQNSLEVTCFLSAVYYDQLIPGRTVAEFPGYKDEKGNILRTPITYKAPAIDPESRTFKIKVKIDDPAKYLPVPVSGMLCELNIILVEREGYGLPEGAVLLRAENKMIAFTVNGENRAESVEIQRGIVDRGYAEIINADQLTGKRFVITGQNFINNNSLLKEIEKERK